MKPTHFYRFALATLAFIASSAFAYPAFQILGDGDGKPVNVRTSPNSSAKIIATFDDGDQGDYEIVRKSGDWYLLQIGKRQGWVHQSQGRYGNVYIVNGTDGYVNVRAEPTTNSEIYTTIKNGDEILAFAIDDYNFDDGKKRAVKDWVGIYFDAAVTDVGAYIHKSQLKDAPRPK